ncbi:DUF6053 domain-containing protein [Lysobacter enzymogenes]|uniref:DUF6053 domain-containing protein n=1 Tax=Lysobacter enzymogenes TaxID=69 RepID=UPI003CCC99EC
MATTVVAANRRSLRRRLRAIERKPRPPFVGAARAATATSHLRRNYGDLRRYRSVAVAARAAPTGSTRTCAGAPNLRLRANAEIRRSRGRTWAASGSPRSPVLQRLAVVGGPSGPTLLFQIAAT